MQPKPTTRIYRRTDTTKPSNKNNGDAVKNGKMDADNAGAAHLEGSGPRIYARYIRPVEWDKEAMRNQSKSEGKDIPKPKYDRRAS